MEFNFWRILNNLSFYYLFIFFLKIFKSTRAENSVLWPCNETEMALGWDERLNLRDPISFFNRDSTHRGGVTKWQKLARKN
jgi:hypothetical protein